MTGTSVSTHILDTSAGRPAAGVAVELAVRAAGADWTRHATSATDADGRCKDLPALPADTAYARLRFEVEPYLAGRARTAAAESGAAARDGGATGRGAAGGGAEQSGFGPGGVEQGGGAFFPEVAVAFAVTPGQHYHVPLLLSPFGYSVYRGS